MTNNTTNDYLENVIKTHNLNCAGVYSKDQIPPLRPNTWAIINMDNSTGQGTHWVCYKSSKPALYFDSFGLPPPKEIANLSDNIIYNHKQIQDINSTACGYFCIAIIASDDGEPNFFNKTINKFSSLFVVNDSILKSMLKREGIN
jgi:hypothetical protein